MNRAFTMIITGSCVALGALSIYERHRAETYKRSYHKKSEKYDKMQERMTEGLQNGNELCAVMERLAKERDGMRMALKTIQMYANQAINEDIEPAVSLHSVADLAFAVKSQADYILDYVEREEARPDEEHDTEKEA